MTWLDILKEKLDPEELEQVEVLMGLSPNEKIRCNFLRHGEERMNRNYKHVSSIIDGLCTWVQTPQGHEYWSKVANRSRR